LGYEDSQQAWDANPMVQGGTNPQDYANVAILKEAKSFMNESKANKKLGIKHFYDKLKFEVSYGKSVKGTLKIVLK
jgi:hypothetical protein